jgi:phenylacetate-CoA ligase
MSSAESIYLKLPGFLQNAFCSVQGSRIQRSRYGRGFREQLKLAEERAKWSEEKILSYRNDRMKKFLQFCASHVPFYQKRFSDCGFDVRDDNCLNELNRLPILLKSEVRAHIKEICPTKTVTGKRIRGHTSGTTGAGLNLYTTLTAIQEQWAVWWRYRRQHGIHPGTWCGYFGGRSVVPLSQQRPPFWRYNLPGKQIIFSGYHMNSENLRYYIEIIRKRRPLWLHGYPSLLSLLATRILESGTKLSYQIQWITIGAESLLPQQAALIEKAFGVKPLQHYGLAEGVANFSECKMGRLHVDEDFAFVEFIQVQDGPGYRVVGTNISNPATPLIRYDTNDIVMLSEDKCPCGRPGRIVTAIDGRIEDYIILANGARLGRMDHIFKDMVNIGEAQIYQEKPGEIVLRVVKGGGYSEVDEEQLISETQKRVGKDTSIIIQYLSRLERSSTGKLRFVISKIPQAQILGQPSN